MPLTIPGYHVVRNSSALPVGINLTLSGYNSELSNDPFETKRQLLEERHFELNRWIAAQESWTASHIKTRTNLLFAQMKEIWARPE
jgi:hypothetical protein